MDDDRFERCLLLDFYGELLTDKQRECFDLHYNEDLSLSEIAEELGISRQGVWDNIRRAESAMNAMEEKTGIISRFRESRAGLERLRLRLSSLTEMTQGAAREAAESALREIEELMAKM